MPCSANFSVMLQTKILLTETLDFFQINKFSQVIRFLVVKSFRIENNDNKNVYDQILIKRRIVTFIMMP